MVIAFGAYLKVFVYLFFVDDLLTVLAFYPEAFGDFNLLLYF